MKKKLIGSYIPEDLVERVDLLINARQFNSRSVWFRKLINKEIGRKSDTHYCEIIAQRFIADMDPSLPSRKEFLTMVNKILGYKKITKFHIQQIIEIIIKELDNDEKK